MAEDPVLGALLPSRMTGDPYFASPTSAATLAAAASSESEGPSSKRSTRPTNQPPSNTRWNAEVASDEYLITELQRTYNERMTETDRSWITWKDRIAFADFLLDSEQLIPNEETTVQRKKAIVSTICKRAESIPGLGQKWARERHRVPGELFEELRFKLEQERGHLALAQQRRQRQKEILEGRGSSSAQNGGSGGGASLSDNGIFERIKKIRQENWRLNRMLGNVKHIEHTQFYALESICAGNRALAGLTLFGAVMAVFCQDTSFIMVTAIPVIPAVLLGYLVAKVSGRPALPIYALYMCLLAFCYLVYAIMRTLFYNYGEGQVKNFLMITVWAIEGFLLIEACLALTLYGMRKTVRRYQIHRVLPKGGERDKQKRTETATKHE